MDNIDVRDLSVRWLRSQIGLVRQEPVLFNNTVRENIRYGREDATDAEVQTAAQQANAHYFIINLPKVWVCFHIIDPFHGASFTSVNVAAMD